MRFFSILNCIDNNQNIVWGNGVYSHINSMHSYGIASNEQD